MKTIHLLFATATLLVPAAASATVITQTYIAKSFFSSGAYPSVTQNFTISFDPTVIADGLTITGYTVDNTSPSFNLEVLASISSGSSNNTLRLYGAPNDSSIRLGTNDFFLDFDIDSSGRPISGPDLLYALVGNGLNSSTPNTGSVTVGRAAGSVPEPATWLMMIVGFGLTGATLRARPRLGVSYA